MTVRHDGAAELTVRQQAVRVLLTLVGLVVAAQVVGSAATMTGGLAVIQELDRPVTWLVVCALALTGAAVAAARTTAARVLAVLGTGPVALLAVPVFLFASAGWEETARHPAPGGVHRDLVVEEGSDLIDPLWAVSVRQGSGITAHRWKVGEFNGDDPADELVSVGWDGPDRIRLTRGDGRVQLVELAPDGRPRTEVR
ncbi:hypothetical protein ACIRBX_09770 [Kitasatospora sp. NPDC096147]|uniref:hypothetical protein n=1 Tax=Kitasatospora sp. NPDC096147 TaxID=3364093 RepID=UPI0038166DCF